MAPPFSDGMLTMVIKSIVSLLAAASVAVTLSAPVAAEPEVFAGSAGDFEFAYDSGLVSIDARDAPLSEILDEIGRQAGFDITITEDVPANVQAAD